jgi:hypothetical protein
MLVPRASTLVTRGGETRGRDKRKRSSIAGCTILVFLAPSAPVQPDAVVTWLRSAVLLAIETFWLLFSALDLSSVVLATCCSCIILPRDLTLRALHCQQPVRLRLLGSTSASFFGLGMTVSLDGMDILRPVTCTLCESRSYTTSIAASLLIGASRSGLSCSGFAGRIRRGRRSHGTRRRMTPAAAVLSEWANRDSNFAVGVSLGRGMSVRVERRSQASAHGCPSFVDRGVG